MNREMLLESNNIDFEPKLLYIRQMVEKIFKANEEPIIDDVLCSPASIKLEGVNKVETLENNVEIDRSWSDVKEIFATLNKQATTSKNSFCNQSVEDDKRKIVQTKRKIAEKCSKIQESVRNKENRFDETEHNTQKIGPTTKSSVHSIKNASDQEFNSIVNSNTTVELATEKSNVLSPMKSSSSTTNSAELKPSSSSVNNTSGHVRQLNVEMFTVTLKRRDPPKNNAK